jgi:hypothetical protein
MIGFNSGFGGLLGGILMKKDLIGGSRSGRIIEDP